MGSKGAGGPEEERNRFIFVLRGFISTVLKAGGKRGCLEMGDLMDTDCEVLELEGAAVSAANRQIERAMMDEDIEVDEQSLNAECTVAPGLSGREESVDLQPRCDGNGGRGHRARRPTPENTQGEGRRQEGRRSRGGEVLTK